MCCSPHYVSVCFCQKLQELVWILRLQFIVFAAFGVCNDIYISVTQSVQNKSKYKKETINTEQNNSTVIHSVALIKHKRLRCARVVFKMFYLWH